ncbi:MAG: glycosyltransferase family 4 protein [Proteobacteria bacterium]|nr:glycosyltransferase family 4 protein [Pseudomonadota bacterium]
MPLRILIVITRGELGGAQTHIFELCRALRHEFIFHVAIGGSERSPLEEQLDELGIESSRIPGLSNSYSPQRLLRGVFAIRSLIGKWQADVVHVHSAVASVVGRLAARTRSVPSIYTVHGFGFKAEVPFMRRSIAYLAEQILAPITSHLLCVSSFEMKMSEALLISRTKVSQVSNGIADSPLRADPAIDPPMFIMVARMEAPKRQDLVVAAIEELCRRGSAPPQVIFAGGGPLLDKIDATRRKAKATTVQLPGDLRDIPERLSATQVFVLISDHEGQPISIIEAMRAGLPIIASNLPGIRTQVSDGNEGLLVTNDAVSIADAMEMLIQSPELRTSMGQRSRERYESEFSASSMARRVAVAYQAFGRRAPGALPLKETQ